jgi:transcriptional regulator with XRE-family HTH domain
MTARPDASGRMRRQARPADEAAAANGTGQGWLSQVSVHLGRRMRARRRQLGLSLEDLGRALGVGYQQVQKYETGENRIGADRLPDLACALRVRVDHFFEGLPQDGAAEAPRADDSLAELLDAYARITDPELRGHLLLVIKALSQSGLGRDQADHKSISPSFKASATV